MNQAARVAFAAAAAGIFAAGFLLGRYSTPAQRHDVTESGTRSAAGEAPAALTASPASDGTPGNSEDRGPATALTPATPANTATGSAAPMRPAKRTTGGPQPLLPGDMALFEATEKRTRTTGGSSADLLELFDSEDADDGSRLLEQLIADAIRRHGDGLTDLRMSQPRCTRSVCGFRAVGPAPIPSVDPNNPSGFMKLTLGIGNEPWFRQHFDDMHSSTSLQGDSVVYLAMFLRCEPGSCRFGNR